MSLFKPAENKAAFLKMGLLGFGGSGKTYTASLIAIGLYKAAIKKQMPYAERPVYFIDTEGGSDYVVDLFAKHGVPLLVAKSRAFSDLVDAMREAEASGSVMIIDSITHFWTEFQEAYKAKKKRTRGLEFQDWAVVKQQWRQGFTEPYLNASLHILMCGRAAWEYDNYTDQSGKRQIERAGVRMSAEKELGFEPSLLVFMEREVDPDTARVVHKAIVMKDRFDVLDGAEMSNPTFKDFAPHIGKLAWGTEHSGVDTSRTSQDMIEPDQYDRRRTDREIAIDLIGNLLQLHFSASKEDKAKRLELLDAAFGTSSMTEIEKRLSLEDLQMGYDRMHLQLEGRPSRYGEHETAANAPVEEDEIPFLSEDGEELPSLSKLEAAE